MTLLDEGPVDLTGPSFGFSLDTLYHFGVHLPEVQEALLTDRSGCSPVYGQSGYAIAAMPLFDPVNAGQPLVVRDETNDALTRVVVPMPVELDPSLWVQISDPDAARFPSLTGRVITPTLFAREYGSMSIGEPRVFRVWDLWPAHEASVMSYFHALLRVCTESPYEALVRYLRFEQGLDDPCDVVEGEVPIDEHVHLHVGLAGDYECRSAVHEAELLEERLGSWMLMPDEEEVWIPWAFTPTLGLPWPEAEHWDQLVRSSTRNWRRARDAVSRDAAALDSERKYCPWS